MLIELNIQKASLIQDEECKKCLGEGKKIFRGGKKFCGV